MSISFILRPVYTIVYINFFIAERCSISRILNPFNLTADCRIDIERSNRISEKKIDGQFTPLIPIFVSILSNPLYIRRKSFSLYFRPTFITRSNEREKRCKKKTDDTLRSIPALLVPFRTERHGHCTREKLSFFWYSPYY